MARRKHSLGMCVCFRGKADIPELRVSPLPTVIKQRFFVFSSARRSSVCFMIVAPCSIMDAIVAAASSGRRSAIHTTVVPPLTFARACADAL